jgi:hypothetical protein
MYKVNKEFDNFWFENNWLINGMKACNHFQSAK